MAQPPAGRPGTTDLMSPGWLTKATVDPKTAPIAEPALQPEFGTGALPAQIGNGGGASRTAMVKPPAMVKECLHEALGRFWFTLDGTDVELYITVHEFGGLWTSPPPSASSPASRPRTSWPPSTASAQPERPGMTVLAAA